MDLKSLTIDDLLSDIDDRDSPRVNWVDRWLTSQDIHPGTTRVRAMDLYAEFTTWYAANGGITGEIPKIRTFGRELTMRYRRSRNVQGTVYYISRSKDPKIPKYLGK